MPDGIVSLDLSLTNGSTAPLELPEHPTISRITAASSAAVGPLSSPEMFHFIADSVVKTMPLTQEQEELLRGGLADAFRPGGSVEQCMPTLIDELGVPVGDVDQLDGHKLMDTESLNRYRMLDGTFGENMGAANAVSRLQQDCDADDPSMRGDLDCDTIPNLIMYDNAPQAGIQTTGGSLEVLFTNYSTPTLGFGGLVRLPPTTVFAEAFPPRDAFIEYEPYHGSSF
eukprot:3636010-Prymnesium_polylepis.1